MMSAIQNISVQLTISRYSWYFLSVWSHTDDVNLGKHGMVLLFIDHDCSALPTEANLCNLMFCQTPATLQCVTVINITAVHYRTSLYGLIVNIT